MNFTNGDRQSSAVVLQQYQREHESKQNSTCPCIMHHIVNEGRDHVQLLRAVTVGVVMDNGSRLDCRLHNNSAIWPGFI